MTEFLQPYDYVERNAAERPGDVATSDGEQRLSWSALRDLTKRIARELRDRGVGPGDVVGFRLPPYLNTVLALAVFHEAAIYAPFNLDMVDDSESEFALVLSNKPIDGWPLERTLIVSNSWFEKIHMNSTIIDQKRYPEDDGVLRHAVTSGTTKRSRVIRFGWVTTAARATRQLELTPGAHQLMSLIGGRSEGGINQLLISLITGNPYLVPNEPTQNVTLISQFQVDVLRGSPHQLADLVRELERTGQRLPSVTTILPLGAALPSAVSEKLVALTDCPEIGNSYAATEVGSMCIRFTHSDDPNDMGEVRDGTEFQIVDPETLEPVPDGVVGVVRARRDYMAHEYYKNPEATAASFRDGWFYPGDLGVLNGRRFTLHGRLSEIINAGGSKIDPATVDEACGSLQGIEDCAAFGVVDASGAIVVALAYVSARELEPRVVQTLARDKLGHRAPVVYVRVAEIPRTETGKVARNALSARFSVAGTATAGAARDDAVERVAPEGFVQPFEFLARARRDNPDGRALVEMNRSVSWREFHFVAKQFATVLRDAGVKPGDIVAINLPTMLQLHVTMAVFHEAAVVAPFIPSMIVNKPIAVDWIVTNRRFNRFPDTKQIVLDDTVLSRIGNLPREIAPRHYGSPDDLLRIAFSNGTTGTPKAIPFTVRETEVRSLDHESRTLSTHQFMCLMPPKIGMGWWSWYASVVGGRPYLVPGDPLESLRLIRHNDVDSIMASPQQVFDMVELIEKSNTTLPSLAVVQVGGSQLSRVLIDRIRKFTSAKIVNAYGSTEVGPTTLRLDDDTDPSYVGETLPGVEVETVDPDTFAPLTPGSTGLIRLKRHTMVHRYLDNPHATAEAWRDGWFHTGDLGRVEGSKLYLAGRANEVINLGGAKLDPNVIDTEFYSVEAFRDFAAFAFHGEDGRDRVALAYVADDDVDEGEFHARFLPILKDFTPVRFVRIDEIPRNELGKPQRVALREWFESSKPEDHEEDFL